MKSKQGKPQEAIAGQYGKYVLFTAVIVLAFKREKKTLWPTACNQFCKRHFEQLMLGKIF